MSTPERPLKAFLLRAVYEWINENRYTPYILVDTDYPGVQVPEQYVRDSRIVLNLKPEAVQGLVMSDDLLEFGARFGGVARIVRIPIGAALALYAKETGKGLTFDRSDDNLVPPPPATPVTHDESGSGNKPSGKPRLRIVK